MIFLKIGRRQIKERVFQISSLKPHFFVIYGLLSNRGSPPPPDFVEFKKPRPDRVNIPPNSTKSGKLDYPITSEELDKAKYILKRGKANGLDNVSNEMISCFLACNDNSVTAGTRLVPDVSSITNSGVAMNSLLPKGRGVARPVYLVPAETVCNRPSLSIFILRDIDSYT